MFVCGWCWGVARASVTSYFVQTYIYTNILPYVCLHCMYLSLFRRQILFVVFNQPLNSNVCSYFIYAFSCFQSGSWEIKGYFWNNSFRNKHYLIYLQTHNWLVSIHFTVCALTSLLDNVYFFGCCENRTGYESSSCSSSSSPRSGDRGLFLPLVALYKVVGVSVCCDNIAYSDSLDTLWLL